MKKHIALSVLCLGALAAFAKPSFAASDYSVFKVAFKKAAKAGKTSFTVNLPAGSIDFYSFQVACNKAFNLDSNRDSARVKGSPSKMVCKAIKKDKAVNTVLNMTAHFNGYGH